MANIKFYKKGNYIILEDSATGLYHEEHASKVYVKKKLLADSEYAIYVGENRWLAQNISEIQKENGLSYNKEEFEYFYQNETGTRNLDEMIQSLINSNISDDGKSNIQLQEQIFSTLKNLYEEQKITNNLLKLILS